MDSEIIFQDSLLQKDYHVKGQVFKDVKVFFDIEKRNVLPDEKRVVSAVFEDNEL